MDNNNTAEDQFVDAEVIDPVVSELDPHLSSVGPPEYVTPADDLKGQKEKEAHLVGREWKDPKKDSKKDKKGQQQQRKEKDDDDNGDGDAGGINGVQSTVIISVAVVAVVGVLLAVTRKFCVR